MGQIVILMGSPRPNGNTARLCQAVAEGARSRGHRVEVIPVAQLTVGGCTGCNACFHTVGHRCVQKDDMTLLYPQLALADVLVLATPLYFYGASAQLKAVIDRLHSPIRDSFRVSKLALVAVAGNQNPDCFHPLVSMYHAARSYFHLEDGGVLTVPGALSANALADSPVLQQAFQLGETLL